MALWFGLALAQSSGSLPFHLDWPYWIAIHAMALTGALDDRFNLRARYKAGVGLAVALLLAFHVSGTLGQTVSQVPFFGMFLPVYPVVVIPLLAMWFWALPQAYNLIDGINGLSMGYASLLVGVLGWNLGFPPALLWGGLLGVLLLNFPRAHHFLGDCGALMLGTLFAILGVEAFAVRDPNLLLWVFAYPIVDVSLVVGIRRWNGHRLSQADRSHLHHWMMDQVGGRSWAATPLLLVLAALPMTRALSFSGHLVVSILGSITLVALTLKAFMDRIVASSKPVPANQIRREVPLMAPSAAREASGSHRRA